VRIERIFQVSNQPFYMLIDFLNWFAFSPQRLFVFGIEKDFFDCHNF